jgi:GDPmannose 4,6-dehydratase
MMLPMLQQKEPEDFIIATGVQRSVREFVGIAARELGIENQFSGAAHYFD